MKESAGRLGRKPQVQKPFNPNATIESIGPGGKIRGTVQQLIDKYTVLGKEALRDDDGVLAEAFFQHAEHYRRILNWAAGQVRDSGVREGAAREGGSRDSGIREPHSREGGARDGSGRDSMGREGRAGRLGSGRFSEDLDEDVLGAENVREGVSAPRDKVTRGASLLVTTGDGPCPRSDSLRAEGGRSGGVRSEGGRADGTRGNFTRPDLSESTPDRSTPDRSTPDRSTPDRSNFSRSDAARPDGTRLDEAEASWSADVGRQGGSLGLAESGPDQGPDQRDLSVRQGRKIASGAVRQDLARDDVAPSVVSEPVRRTSSGGTRATSARGRPPLRSAQAGAGVPVEVIRSRALGAARLGQNASPLGDASAASAFSQTISPAAGMNPGGSLTLGASAGAASAADESGQGSSCVKIGGEEV